MMMIDVFDMQVAVTAKKMCVMAASADDKQQWIDAIKKRIVKHERVSKRNEADSKV